MAALEQYYGTGRRKTSVARVFMRPGSGKITVNGAKLDEHFGPQTAWNMIVYQPLVALSVASQFDCLITVKGGGNSGQAGAIRLGITRALLEYEKEKGPQTVAGAAAAAAERTAPAASEDEGEGSSGASEPEKRTWRMVLRRLGYVTRDARKVERKKVGLHKARKAIQYSKR